MTDREALPQDINNNNDEEMNTNQIKINSEVMRITHKRTIGNVEQVKEYEIKTGKVEIIENAEQIPIEEEPINSQNEPIKKELTKKEIYVNYVTEAEDNCDKCPLRCLVCIPICIGYGFLSLYDFITYLLAPFGLCAVYTIAFIYNSCKNVISTYQVEEEIGFSGAFTSENEIRLHINEEGGAFHLTEILCFSYMSACIKRYFCFIFVLINHIVVPILQSWNRAKKCFRESKIEQLYDERVRQIQDASSYKGYDNVEPQIELINI